MTDDTDSNSDTNKSSDINNAEVQDVVRAIRDCKGHYAFLIGAGTSKPAGIPTGGDLIWEWRKERYGEEHDENPDDVADEEIVDWAESFEDDHMDGVKNSYGFWFEQVHTTPGQRRHLIREKVEDKKPTFGSIVLASLMADKYIPLTLTPNFDDLVYDALYRFLEEKPLVINHDAVAAEFSLTKQRPMIIKLHGDYLFNNLQNLAKETSNLKENMERAFSLALNEYGLIVVGYGGNDTSIMDEVILNDIDIPEYGIYWCAREQSELSEKAERLLERDNTYFVEIDGSEAFFTKLANRIPGVSPPDEEDLRESAEAKIKAIDQTIEQREEEAESKEVEKYIGILQYKSKVQNLTEAGKWQELLEVASSLIELAPERSTGYFYRGYAHDELGNYEQAIEDYDTTIDLDSEYVDAYNNRGNSYSSLDDHEKAIEDYDTAIDLNPEYAVAYNNRGDSYHSLGDYKRAIEDYNAAIDLDETLILALANRAEAHIELEEYEQARDDAVEAYELADDTDYVAISLLLLLISKTVLDEATDELEQQYREACNKDFTLSWDFTQFNRWLGETDLDDEKEEYIREMIALLEDHKEDT